MEELALIAIKSGITLVVKVFDKSRSIESDQNKNLSEVKKKIFCHAYLTIQNKIIAINGIASQAEKQSNRIGHQDAKCKPEIRVFGNRHQRIFLKNDAKTDQRKNDC